MLMNFLESIYYFNEHASTINVISVDTVKIVEREMDILGNKISLCILLLALLKSIDN